MNAFKPIALKGRVRVSTMLLAFSPRQFKGPRPAAVVNVNDANDTVNVHVLHDPHREGARFRLEEVPGGLHVYDPLDEEQRESLIKVLGHRAAWAELAPKK